MKQAHRRFDTNISLIVKARERLRAYNKADVENPWETMDGVEKIFRGFDGPMKEASAENRAISPQKGEKLMCSRALLCLALARVSFLRPRERILLADLLEGVDDFLKIDKNDIEALIGRKIRTPGFIPSDFVKKAQSDELYLTKRNILCTFYSSREYPALLKEIYDPPLVLFYRGVLPKSAVSAAVVGTRKPTGKALKAAFRLGFELAEQGVCVISGLAMGIDRAAHRGCIEGNGCAVAVLGSGIEAVYPRTSRTLAEMILERGGAIVSEYPPGTLPLKYHFPARNRIISGLADAVVVVEAPEKSGALITCDYALEQGRELFVHEAGINSAQGRGTTALAEQGARRITGAEEVFPERAGISGKTDRSKGLRTEQERGNHAFSLAELFELELQDKLILRDGEIYWKEEHDTEK